MPLASQNSYPIMVYSVANYSPHLSHFFDKCDFRDLNLSCDFKKREFYGSRLLIFNELAGTNQFNCESSHF